MGPHSGMLPHTVWREMRDAIERTAQPAAEVDGNTQGSGGHARDVGRSTFVTFILSRRPRARDMSQRHSNFVP
jgi:hypothetical protein